MLKSGGRGRTPAGWPMAAAAVYDPGMDRQTAGPSQKWASTSACTGYAASGQLGRIVSGNRESGSKRMSGRSEGQPLRPARDAPGGLGGLPHQANVSVGVLPSHGDSQGRDEGDRGFGSSHARGHLPSPQPGRRICGDGRRSLRSPQPAEDRGAITEASPESGLRGGDPTGCETAPTRIGADGTWQRSGMALTGGRSSPQPARLRTQAKRPTLQMRRAGNYLPAWGHGRE